MSSNDGVLVRTYHTARHPFPAPTEGHGFTGAGRHGGGPTRPRLRRRGAVAL